MFTAEEYRTAARVLGDEADLAPDPEMVSHLVAKAEKLDARDTAAYTIGANARLWSKTHSDVNLGLNILAALLKAGWTPPEGLF